MARRSLVLGAIALLGTVVACFLAAQVASYFLANQITHRHTLAGPVLAALGVVLALAIVGAGIAMFQRARVSRPRAKASAATPSSSLSLGDPRSLNVHITRLEQLRDWMAENPDFGRLVDNMIGQQVHEAERRQRSYALAVTIASSVVSLIAGWLLSGVSPVAVAQLLPH